MASDRVFLHVDRDGLTGRLQLGISVEDERGAGHGYRIAGPKYSGTGTNVLRAALDERDIAQIRSYLDIAERALAAPLPARGEHGRYVAAGRGGEQ